MTNASFKTVDPSRRVVGYVRVSRNRDSETSTNARRARCTGSVTASANELVPDPDVAPHVAEAARLIAEGTSVLAAVRMMHDNGVMVTHVGLKVALQSSTIAGLVAVSSEALPRRGGVRQLADAELEEGDWEPIVDRDLWSE